MANETVNYGYPKPEEDDFYDINQFNQAMDMIDGDLKKTEEMKQNKLDIGAFTGNIDVLGEGGLPRTSSVSWCRSELVSGTLPVLSDAAYCFSLETCVAAENERDSARVQRAVLHETANIRILERMYVDGQWHEWKELLQKDGDLKDATVTFDSGDNESPAEWAEVAPVEGGEKQGSLWQKVSLFARNLRYLWKLCGTNDISGLADGTLTGAVSKLNTDLSEKANLSGENRYDSTNLVSKIVGVNKDSFVHAQFVAESQNKADSTSRAGYGFHNDGITGGFLYLDNDHKLKFIDAFGGVHVIIMESP
ncbi:hypothetical protein C805_00609 [Eubacterium sp. 14-2]|uniref:hypothetical protein n=2 Tax=Eubacterium sp. 14-2 TaxID=1235790 RepID=UPI000339201A|nr:hypothetical protein [Eubacterium sp. 14-2]EOT26517.1 hypothetical protein C805_00609 [Eubacterium sp. 14-2]